MEEPLQKRTRVSREEWAKRVERWRDSGLSTAEFAAELGINPHSLTYWAWTLKREAGGQKRVWPKKSRKQAVARNATVSSTPFVEVKSHTPRGQFELEIRGRRLHIPDGFDAQQLRSLLAVLETA
jgi:transposase-like protein